MPWPCQLFEISPDVALPLFRAAGDCEYSLTYQQLPIGAMWLDDDELTVKLPDNSEWNVDRGRKINHVRGAKVLPAWERSGVLPLVTASPSIHCVGRYHGWLRDGVLSDDIDGRTFPP